MYPHPYASLMSVVVMGLAFASCEAPGASASTTHQHAAIAHQEALRAPYVSSPSVVPVRTAKAVANPVVDRTIALRTALRPTLAAVAESAFGARWRLSVNGLPKGTRQTVEGYWIGALPDAEHLEELHHRGVRLLVSAARLAPSVVKARDKLGLAHFDTPFGSRFPSARPLLATVEEVEPDAIYIHCVHGADRSGAILAFLLAVRHGWSPQRALLAVAQPVPFNLRHLRRQLRKSDMDVTDEEVERYAGMYSAERNGHFGGLKATGPKYHRLIRTTLEAIAYVGVQRIVGAQPVKRASSSSTSKVQDAG